MKKNILILSDRYNLRHQLINLGDRALSKGLYNLLHQNFNCSIESGGWKNFPYINIKLFKNNNTKTIFEKHYKKLTNFSKTRLILEYKLAKFLQTNFLFTNKLFKYLDTKIQKKFTRGIIQTIQPYLLKKYYTYKFLNKVKKADLIVFNGGGLIADHLIHYLPSLMFEIYIAKKLNKKIITVNQTVSVKNPLAKQIVSHTYKDLDFHTVREPLSKQNLISMGIKENQILSTCDSAFNIKLDQIQVKEYIQKGDICICLRGDLKTDINAWSDIIKYIKQKHKRNIFFIHTCKSHDEKIYNSLAKRSPIKKLKKDYDYLEIINILSNFDLIITDRYHGSIFAILSNTPVVPVTSTTFKTQGLFSLFDYPIPISNRQDYQEIKQSIDFAIKNKDQLKAILSKAKQDLIKKVQTDMKEVAKHLNYKQI